MKKRILVGIICLAVFAFAAPLVLAQGAVAEGTPAPAQEIKAADLEVQNVGILPTSGFYFLKEWRRGISRFFTFNSVKKAELDLKIADEKAAELLEVQKTAPEETEGALKNYEKAQERLKKTLEDLKETSQNPNVDRLLEKLADRTVKHIQLFDELSRKAEHDTLKPIIQNIRAKVMETAGGASEKDEPEKFAEKIGKALEGVKGGELKNLRALEIIDEFENTAPEDLKNILRDKYRPEFYLKLKDDLSGAIEKGDLENIKEHIAELPGDAARRSVIFDEFNEKIKDNSAYVWNQGVKKIGIEEKGTLSPLEFQDAIEKIGEISDKIAEEDKHIAEKSAEQIKRAEEAIKQLGEMELSNAFLLLETGLTHGSKAGMNPLRQTQNSSFGENIKGGDLTQTEAGAYGTKTGRNPLRQTQVNTVEEEKNMTEMRSEVSNLLNQAKDHLEKAKKAFGEGKYGEAFGQARAAEVLARIGMWKFQSPARNKKLRDEEEIKNAEECGIKPGAPGDWVCEDGKWKNEKSESGNEIKRVENKASEDESLGEKKKTEEVNKNKETEKMDEVKKTEEVKGTEKVENKTGE